MLGSDDALDIWRQRCHPWKDFVSIAATVDCFFSPLVCTAILTGCGVVQVEFAEVALRCVIVRLNSCSELSRCVWVQGMWHVARLVVIAIVVMTVPTMVFRVEFGACCGEVLSVALYANRR